MGHLSYAVVVSGVSVAMSIKSLVALSHTDLLEQGADIRVAKHTLPGANANVGVARVAFFPHFTLTAREAYTI
ncbi:hypothetical protein [Gluconobacter kanchanaburiensis]|uniref:Uncharacterized protein n=2 Tax=Gluconobacter kanchanaburiensis TaxID=563199 RepID=A0A511BCY7_9PROT|nr:hypothetical protein [Gluconobacter kanchanaburiensis]MBF0863009.1 hypothetical protein [Gluconobacter kanchanaburiensis]GEK97463.1 hypothetical protein GKA01_26600 [Gluconobacter kanchanaburiensis NBRC 103587]